MAGSLSRSFRRRRETPLSDDPAAFDGPTRLALPLEASFEGAIAGSIEGSTEGAGGGEVALAAAVEELRRLGLEGAGLRIRGGRFTIRFEGERRPGDRLDAERKNEILERLQQIADAADPRRPLSSTARCLEVHPEHVVETRFECVVGRIVPRGMVLPRESDRPGRNRASASRLRSLRLGVGLLLLAVAFGIGTGWHDRVLAPSPRALAIETSTFGARLAIEAGHSLGTYWVRVLRGPRFPRDREARDVWRDRIEAAGDRASALRAHELLTEGGEATIQLLDEEGAVLRTARIDLGPLVRGAPATPSVPLPASSRAAVLQLEPGPLR